MCTSAEIHRRHGSRVETPNPVATRPGRRSPAHGFLSRTAVRSTQRAQRYRSAAPCKARGRHTRTTDSSVDRVRNIRPDPAPTPHGSGNREHLSICSRSVTGKKTTGSTIAIVEPAGAASRHPRQRRGAEAPTDASSSHNYGCGKRWPNRLICNVRAFSDVESQLQFSFDTEKVVKGEVCCGGG